MEINELQESILKLLWGGHPCPPKYILLTSNLLYNISDCLFTQRAIKKGDRFFFIKLYPMNLKHIASLSTIFVIFSYSVKAQVPPETHPGLPQTTNPLNTNISIPDINNIDQTAIGQQFNSGFNSFNSLSQPNCRTSICVFTLIRNSFKKTEFLGGAIWQLGGSPEEKRAEAQKLLAIAQKERLYQQDTEDLIEKLAGAIENKKIERAKLYAIILANRLGYADYRQLLKDVMG